MKLYEVVNEFMGESYVRLYAWAENEAQALELASQQFRIEEERRKYGEPRTAYWEHLTAYELFDSSAAPFATPPSDSGWDNDQD